MKRFFEEHTSVVIICIIVSLLLCIIGGINNINDDGTVAGKGLLKIVGDNLTDTIGAFQKQIIPNENLLDRNLSFSNNDNVNYKTFNGIDPAFSSKEVSGRLWATTVLDTHEIHKILKANTIYTISYDYELTKACNRELPDYDIKVGFIIWDKNNELDDKTGKSNSIGLFASNFKEVNIKRHFSKTFKTPSKIPDAYRLVSYSNRYAGNNGDYDLDTARITNIKLEEGSKATPYIE